MAQTGDVQFGNSSSESFNLSRAGMGGSDKPDLKEEFNDFIVLLVVNFLKSPLCKAISLTNLDEII